MSEETIVTVEINLNDLISSKERVQALERAISSQINSSRIVENIARKLVQEKISESVINDLTAKIEKYFDRNYGTEEKVEKIVLSNSHTVTQKVRSIMENKTEILEKSIMKAMLANGFQNKIAQTVEKEIEDKIIKSLAYFDNDDY